MITLHHVVWALLNSVWQSALLTALVFGATKVVRRSTAGQRYALWSAVVVATLLLPLANLTFTRFSIHSQVSLPAATTLAAPTRTLVAQPRIQAPKQVALVERATQGSTRWSDSTTGVSTVTAVAPASSNPTHGWIVQIAQAIVAGRFDIFALMAWILVADLLIIRLAIGYTSLHRAKQALLYRELSGSERATFARMTARPVAIGYSSALREPCVIGFGRPVIALPLTLALHISPQDIERIIRHEGAHISRWDDYGNLFKHIALAVLCFNPVAFIVSRWLDLEREIACDDVAAELQNDRADFARCLCDIALAKARRAWLPVPGLAKDRRQLFVRVARLLDRNHAASKRLGGLARIGIVVVCIAAVPISLVQVWATMTPPARASTIASPTPTAKVVRPHVSSRTHPKHIAQQRVESSAVKPVKIQVVNIHVHTHLHSLSASRAIRVPVPDGQIFVIPAPAIDVTQTVKAQQALAKAMAALPKELDRSTLTLMARDKAMMTAGHMLDLSRSMVVRMGMGSDAERDDFLDALREAGYKGLSADDLIAIRNAGVSATFLRQLKSYGIAPMPTRDLVALANSGVDARYVAGLRAAGYANVSVTDMVALANAGVEPSYISELNGLGYRGLSIHDLIRLSEAGVTPHFIAHLQKSGVVGPKPLSVDDLIKLSNAGL